MNQSHQFSVFPVQDHGRRKRNREVKSCDQCRSKHLKCHPPPDEKRDERCKKCTDDGLDCTFLRRTLFIKRKENKDRHRRAGAVAAPTCRDACDGSMGSNQSLGASGSGLSVRPGDVISGDAFPAHGDSPAHLGMARYESDILQPSSPTSPTGVAGAPFAQLHTESSHWDQATHLTRLFNPNRPDYPTVELFLLCLGRLSALGSEWTVLDLPKIEQRYHASTLCPTLANAIVSYGVRFLSLSDREEREWLGLPPGVDRGPWDRVDVQYFRMSRRCMYPSFTETPSIDNLIALVLLGWSARGCGASKEFCELAEWAIDMLFQLENHSDLHLLIPEHCTLLYYNVARLDSTVAFHRGTPLRLQPEASIWAYAAINSPSPALQASSFVAGHHGVVESPVREIALMNKDLHHWRLDTARYIAAAHADPNMFPHEPSQLVHGFINKIPPKMRFTRQNFRKYKDTPYATIFAQVYLSIYSFAIVMCYPSILRRGTKADENERLDAACEWAEKLIEIFQFAYEENAMTALLGISSADMPLRFATCVLLKASRLCQHATMSTGSPSSSSNSPPAETASHGDSSASPTPSSSTDPNSLTASSPSPAPQRASSIVSEKVQREMELVIPRTERNEWVLNACRDVLLPAGAAMWHDVRHVLKVLKRRPVWEPYVAIDAYHLGLDAKSANVVRQRHNLLVGDVIQPPADADEYESQTSVVSYLPSNGTLWMDQTLGLLRFPITWQDEPSSFLEQNEDVHSSSNPRSLLLEQPLSWNSRPSNGTEHDVFYS